MRCLLKAELYYLVRYYSSKTTKNKAKFKHLHIILNAFEVKQKETIYLMLNVFTVNIILNNIGGIVGVSKSEYSALW
ncbi:CLUMA_CG011109, isoform A [Clunio marinus]|uniref:CLUMA_CG011109, isoform A n=1 Tax=Clunio marinus TaxID=568069 RepID=A0A1J1IH17_9DIPT|nr:CLUMA_CG011109, isoform A [Clunio marinus]